MPNGTSPQDLAMLQSLPFSLDGGESTNIVNGNEVVVVFVYNNGPHEVEVYRDNSPQGEPNGVIQENSAARIHTAVLTLKVAVGESANGWAIFA